MCETLDEAVTTLFSKFDQPPQTGTPWNDSDFSRLRQETNCSMPSQLREALIEYGGFAFWEEKYFLAQWPDGTSKKYETIFPLSLSAETMIDEFLSFRVDPSRNEDRFPYDMIFFGKANGGNVSLLANGTDPTDNTVYLWEKAGDPWGVGDNAIGIAKVADTFFEFLCGLTDEENL